MTTTAPTNMVSITLNGQPLEVASGTTVLDAAKDFGLSIPTLCSNDRLRTLGACRLCLVEVDSEEQLHSACSFTLTDSVDIQTHSPRVLASRRMTMELLLARSANNSEQFNGREPFHQLVHEMGIRQQRFLPGSLPAPTDMSSPALQFNPNACIQCGLCVAVCNDMQDVHAINFSGRGIEQSIQAGLEQDLADTECNACGQCAVVCPTGAFVEQDGTADVISALGDGSKVVIAAVMPAAQIGIGPEFGFAPGEDQGGKLVNGLKKTGFDFVFDAGFGHDLATMEAAFELRQRVAAGENLPLIISSCPSLVKQIEHLYPELIPNLSKNRSPSQMFGRILKSYYSEKLGRNSTDIVVVQITSCLSSKYERARHELDGVDVSLTTREAARLLRTASGYDLAQLSPMEFDAPFGEASGASALSEVSGGTAEAILRTIGDLVTGADLDESVCTEIRGQKPVREAEIEIGDTVFRVAVAQELGHGNTLLERVKQVESPHHLIEIMACPGGCAGGGGQPLDCMSDQGGEISDALVRKDRERPVRKPRSNRQLNQVYAEFLKAPYGEQSKRHLQTEYTVRGRY